MIKKDINPATLKKFKYIEGAKMSAVKSDIEIARAAKMKPIKEILDGINVPDKADVYSPISRYIAKIKLEYLEKLKTKKDGKLILVTAITPTPAGEGKTTTSVGLTDGLNKIGKKSIVCLREPSLGPSFGMKGGAAGGGHAQVVPMEQINLHFTGDFHAITSAHNLLSALIDNHIYWGNKLNIDVRRIVWKRVMDMNDRSLRSININLGGVANGYPREDGFDITVASEIMAIFCLSNDLKDLEKKTIPYAAVDPRGDIKGGYLEINRVIKQDKTSNFASVDAYRNKGQLKYPIYKREENKKIVYETITIPIPVYVEIDYKITLRTEYQQQMNDMLAPIVRRSNGHKRIMISHKSNTYEAFVEDSYSVENNITNYQQEEKKFETSVNVKVLAYLIGDGSNQVQPRTVRRENPVQIRLARERVITGDEDGEFRF